MANTYKVQDGLTLAQKLAKGVPFAGVDVMICDLVSSVMYKSFPWRDTLLNIAAGTIPCADGVQDFSIGSITPFRFTQFDLVRTDVSPVEHRAIRVAKSLTIDLISKSGDAVRAAAYQAGINKIRLESAIQVPSGVTWEIQGEYQPHPTKITDLQDSLWFADEHLEVYAKGLAYWAFRLADDSRAGEAVKVGDGRVQYSGQLAFFMDAIEQMQGAEDFGNIEGYYPDEPLGTVDGRRYYANDVFPIL